LKLPWPKKAQFSFFNLLHGNTANAVAAACAVHGGNIEAVGAFYYEKSFKAMNGYYPKISDMSTVDHGNRIRLQFVAEIIGDNGRISQFLPQSDFSVVRIVDFNYGTVTAGNAHSACLRGIGHMGGTNKFDGVLVFVGWHGVGGFGNDDLIQRVTIESLILVLQFLDRAAVFVHNISLFYPHAPLVLRIFHSH